MKKISTVILLLGIQASFNTRAGLTPEERAFIQAHSVSSEIATILDKHRASLEREILSKCRNQKTKSHCHAENAVKEFPWLPGYFVKFGVDRVKNALSIGSLIEKNKLGALMVPEKYYYHIPGKPEDLTNANYLVIAKRVELNKRTPLTVRHIEQLVTLIEQHDIDNHNGNIYVISDGRAALIDTGAEAWYASWSWVYDENVTPEQKKFLGVVRFIVKDGGFVHFNRIDFNTYSFLVSKISDTIKSKNTGIEASWYHAIVKKYVVSSIKSLKRSKRKAYLKVLEEHGLL